MFIIGDLCEISMRVFIIWVALICILSVESSGESYERSFIFWIVIGVLCERGRCLSDFLTRIFGSLSWLSFHHL